MIGFEAELVSMYKLRGYQLGTATVGLRRAELVGRFSLRHSHFHLAKHGSIQLTSEFSCNVIKNLPR